MQWIDPKVIRQKINQPGMQPLCDSIRVKAARMLELIELEIAQKTRVSNQSIAGVAVPENLMVETEEALYTLAAAAFSNPQDDRLVQACLQIWRAPLFGKPLIRESETLDAAPILSMLLLCEPFLREWLTDEDYSQVRQVVLQYCNRVEEDIYGGRSWFFGGPNGDDIPVGSQFTSVTSGFLIGALYLLEQEPRAAQWRSLATDLFIRSMKETSEDGSYFEGVGQALPVYAEAFLSAYLLACLGDARLVETPLLRNAAWWLLDSTLPNRKGWLPVNVNTEQSPYNHPLAQRIFLLTLAQKEDPVLNGYFHQILGGPSTDIFGLMLYQPDRPQEEPTAREAILLMLPTMGWLRSSPNRLLLPNLRENAANPDRKVVHYPMQGVIIYRSGFGPQDTLLALKGGWIARGLDHYDRNSFLLYDGNSPIIVESGSHFDRDVEEEKQRSTLRAHNTLEIDGKEIPDVSGVSQAISGHEWVWLEPENVLYLKGNAGAIYPEILHYLRSIHINEHAGIVQSITVTDEILPSDGNDHAAALWFHTPVTAQIEGGALIIPAAVVGERTSRYWRLCIEQVSSPVDLPGGFHFQAEPAVYSSSETLAFTARGIVPAAGIRIVFLLSRWNPTHSF